ncbi:hypothetical protein [Chloroflexus sp.]|uniref:hypothetical protein n=2 Tax=Chloroflexus TaxID=1107 RepID=UPI002FD9B5AF
MSNRELWWYAPSLTMSAPDATQPSSQPQPTLRYLRLIGPHLATVVVSVLIFVILDNWLQPAPPPATPQIATVTPVPTVLPSPLPSPIPVITVIPLDDGLVRLTLLDLQAENAQLRAAIHLLRAAITIDEAIQALQRNDFAEADRTLMAARRALDHAYQLSEEPQKAPIDAIRLQISQIRDDLGVRPEGADRRLWQVRRLILTLVE